MESRAVLLALRTTRASEIIHVKYTVALRFAGLIRVHALVQVSAAVCGVCGGEARHGARQGYCDAAGQPLPQRPVRSTLVNSHMSLNGVHGRVAAAAATAFCATPLTAHSDGRR